MLISKCKARPSFKILLKMQSFQLRFKNGVKDKRKRTKASRLGDITLNVVFDSALKLT